MHDMSNDSQLEQFQREFRENVNNKLDYLTNKIDKTRCTQIIGSGLQLSV